MTSTEDIPTTYDAGQTAIPAPPAPPASHRHVPGWVPWAAGALCVLLALGGGYALGAQSIADERDTAEAALAQAEADLGDAQDARSETEATLEATEAQLAECAELAESSTSLQEAAAGFAGDWSEFVRLMDAWAMTPVGSPEEAEAVEALLAQENLMTPRAGELTAKAAQVGSDVSACDGD